MGREVRKVPANWKHPRDERNRYIPLHVSSFKDAYEEWKNYDLPEWEEGAILWENGYVWSYLSQNWNIPPVKSLIPIPEFIENWNNTNRSLWSAKVSDPTYDWWEGDKPEAPNPDNFMPDWPDSERTHFMMYETTSEGTPISPAFETAEELAHWLADTGASAFADYTATYDEWLDTIGRGWAVGAVMDDKGLRSGVQALADT